MESKILSKNEIEKIHSASLFILENVGVHIPHDEILNRFEKIGANVNFKEKRVRIPHHIVMESIAKAGKKFTLYGMDVANKAEFGVGMKNFNSTGGQAFWLEEIGTERRYSNLNDVKTATKFGHILNQITIPGAMADPQEIPIQWRALEIVNQMIKYTDKPITFWFYDRASTKYLMEILIAARGDSTMARKYPLFQPLFEPVSPLSFPYNGIDLLFETAKFDLPVQIGPMAQMGVSAPCSIAGTLAQENAEILSAICITQLIKPGLPICYGGICHAFDMRSIGTIFGGPEQAIFSIAMTQLGKYYGFPVYINAGLTDSKAVDAQAGLECGITLSAGFSANADIFGHLGICGMDQAASIDMLMMQSEIISYIESMNRDLIINEDTLGLNLIENIGPKGSFLKSMHTLQNYRKELWLPNIINRQDYTSWSEAGKPSLKDKCRELKAILLKQYQKPFIEIDIQREIEILIEKAKHELN